MRTIRETISIQTDILMEQLPKWQVDYINRLIRHLRIPLYQNGYALLLNSVGISVLGVLYWVLAARYYTTGAVGINSATIATMTFLASVARLYLDGALIRFLPRSGKAASRIIRYSYSISSLAGVVVSIIFLMGLSLWAPALGSLRSSPLLTIVFVLATVAFTIFVEQDGVLTGLRQAKWVPVENILYALAKLILLVALAGSFPDYGIFISWVVPLIISLIPVNLLIFRKLLPEHIVKSADAETHLGASEIIHYAGGLYIGYLFSMASLQLLPLVVLWMEGSSASAYFTLPWTIMASMQVVIPSLMGSMIVEASRDQGQLVKYSRQAFLQIARILVPVIIILFVGAPYLLGLFGESYASESTTLLRLLSLAAVPQMFIGLYLGIARVRGLIGGVIAVHVTSFLIVISLSYFFLTRYGITGVGMAWLINQTAVAMFLFFSQLRHIFSTPRSR
jgi:O-antigen/teichoic acid export membrane protein